MELTRTESPLNYVRVGRVVSPEPARVPPPRPAAARPAYTRYRPALRGQRVRDGFSRLSTRVPILFLIPAVRRMVVASRIRLHGGVRTVLPHAPVFVRASQRVRRAQMGGVEVSAGRHKSDCRSTAGEDQQGLRVCGLEGRRSMQ